MKRLFVVLLLICSLISSNVASAGQVRLYLNETEKELTWCYDENTGILRTSNFRVVVYHNGCNIKSLKYKSTNKGIATVDKRGYCKIKKVGKFTVSVKIKYTKYHDTRVKSKTLKCKCNVVKRDV